MSTTLKVVTIKGASTLKAGRWRNGTEPWVFSPLPGYRSPRFGRQKWFRQKWWKEGKLLWFNGDTGGGMLLSFPKLGLCAAEGEENQIRCSGMMAAGWVYPQRHARMRARAFLVTVLIVVRLSLFTVQPQRCHVVWISPAGSENRGILHESNHWMRSFRSPSPSAHTHARRHAPQRAYKSLLIAMWNHPKRKRKNPPPVFDHSCTSLWKCTWERE